MIRPSALPASASAVDILGTPVAVLDTDHAIRIFDEILAARRFTPVSFLNAHNANVSVANREFAAAMKDFLILADGVGVDMASKALYGRPFPANLNGTDFIPALLAALKRPMSVGLVGTTQKNAEAAAEKLRSIAPQHEVMLISDGFFSVEKEKAILCDLERKHPDILLVAMGVPRQELWIRQKLDGRHCTIAIGVGALLDFLSGSVPRAPAWIRRMRLEWMYRLWQEPGRLWRRYIIGNPLFIYRVLRQRQRQRAGKA